MLAFGLLQLTFRNGNRSVTRTHDQVVLALPFSVLRGVTLDASLGLPTWKTEAIAQLGYGDNAKMMIGFDGPIWGELGSSGASYSDLANHQTTWETNWTQATSAHAILTDYSTYPVNAAQSVYYDDVKMSTSYIGNGGGATPPAAPTNLRVIR